jgi:hypothetical protein
VATSISDRDPQLSEGMYVVAGETVRLTVTGVDEKGQMFRETAGLLSLDGRECRFRSKFQPELGSWVLVELNSSKAGTKPCTLQGQVKSVQPEGVTTNLFQIQLELEAAQDLKVASSPQQPPVKSQKLQPPAGPPAEIESKDTPKTVPPAPFAPAKQEANVQTFPRADIQSSKVTVPVKRELSTPAQAETAGEDLEAVKSAAAPEVSQQWGSPKSSRTKELEQMVQLAVTSSIEKTARETIEKQISVNYQAAIQTLNSDLAYQLLGRLANSEELRASVEGMAKKILEEQTELSRNAVIEAQRNLNSRAAEIVRSLEESMAMTESRINAARDGVTATLDRARALEREVTEATARLQKGVEHLNQAARSTIEKFDGHVTAQLNSWSAQFKNHLDGVSREKATQFATDLEKHPAPHLQDAKETLEKISAGLQLMQGTVRLQEGRLAELSRAAAAAFEKEIKTVLLRLAGTV